MKFFAGVVVYNEGAPAGAWTEHADQYGFNRPIVEEYERRYGVSILEKDFDLENWRSFRGEYFNTASPRGRAK
jgi:hypothetical protein